MSVPEFSAPTRQSHGRSAMDRMYRHQRHIYDASRKFYLLGRDRLIRDLSPPRGGHVLEIGCGTGRNLITAARRYPLAEFYGVDISGEMLKTATTSIARQGLAERVRLAEGDATCFNPRHRLPRTTFDRVFLSYTLSMIPQWEQAIACAITLLAPEGQLHVVDFGQCEKLPSSARALLFRWLRVFDVSPRAELRRVLEEEAQRHAMQSECDALFGGYAWHARIGHR